MCSAERSEEENPHYMNKYRHHPKRNVTNDQLVFNRGYSFCKTKKKEELLNVAAEAKALCKCFLSQSSCLCCCSQPPATTVIPYNSEYQLWECVFVCFCVCSVCRGIGFARVCMCYRYVCAYVLVYGFSVITDGYLVSVFWLFLCAGSL